MSYLIICRNIYSFSHQSCSSVTVFPVTSADPEIVCTVAEDMAYYSHYYLYPAYIDSCVKTKFLRDGDSAEMVDILLGGIRFDIALLSGSSAIDDLRTLLTKRNDNVASEFAKKESKYVSQFEKNLADVIG